MKRVLIFVLMAFVAVACSKNSNHASNKSPASTATTANGKSAASPGTSGGAAGGNSAGGSSQAIGGPNAKTSDTVRIENDPGVGTILATGSGMTLYKFDNDSREKSSCESTCSTTWPPLTVSNGQQPTGVAGLSVFTRSDGKQQVAFHGVPLYTYSGDTKAGDANGDGFAGKWHVISALEQK